VKTTGWVSSAVCIMPAKEIFWVVAFMDYFGGNLCISPELTFLSSNSMEQTP